MEADLERGKRIKSLRTKRGWTLQQLADAVGVRHFQSVQKWEAGQPLSYPNLLKLARALDTSTENILGEQVDIEPEDLDARLLRVEGGLLSLVRNEIDTLGTRVAGVSSDFQAFAQWSRNVVSEINSGLAVLREASEGQTTAVEGLSDQVQALRSELRELRGSVEAAAAREAPARQRRKPPAAGDQ